jgi:hypothetical protein
MFKVDSFSDFAYSFKRVPRTQREQEVKALCFLFAECNPQGGALARPSSFFSNNKAPGNRGTFL